jgi:hypothetical protein
MRSLLLAAALAPLAAGALGAQLCTPLVTRTAPGALTGRRIDSLRIVTLPPYSLPRLPAAIDRIHVRTRERTIRRQLLFAAGDTVDTLRIAETMRRLRRQRYLADAWLEARACDTTGGVSLALTTRDAWSTRPEVKMSASGTATVGLRERNLLGTGRAVSVYVRSAGTHLGVGAMLSDPWVPYANVAGTARWDSYRNGSEWSAVIETRRLTIFEPWQAELTLTGSTNRGSDDSAGVFIREGGSLLVGRVVSASAFGATSLLAGVEASRSRLAAAPDAALLGPTTVRREFAGVDIGVRRESASYDTLTWLLPGRALADVPLGFEGEVVTGLGRDDVSGMAMLHLDLWGGRVWMPRRDRLIVADVWSSGFLGSGRWDAGTVRALVSYFAAARRGTWQAHLAAEQLFAPDPDIRALATLDPALPLFPKSSRLAESAITAALERTVHLRQLSRSWGLDGALFTALSMREDPVSPNPERLYAGVVGFGVRLAPLRPGRGTFRVDIGFPIVRSPELRRRPYISVLVVPWLGANRERDGRLKQ